LDASAHATLLDLGSTSRAKLIKLQEGLDEEDGLEMEFEQEGEDNIYSQRKGVYAKRPSITPGRN